MKRRWFRVLAFNLSLLCAGAYGFVAGAQNKPPPNAHLSYLGGPMIPNAKVVAVLWGNQINVEVSRQIGGVLQILMTNSPYLDWLNEYNVAGQAFGRGLFLGTYTITPTIRPPSLPTSLSAADIQTELGRQIDAAVLPAPDANTVYMVYFPPEYTLFNSRNQSSCGFAGFCATHDVFSHNSKIVQYAVFPDFYSANPGCNAGCGPNSSFDNLTARSSHELVEMMTDGQGTSVPCGTAGRAWYDTNNCQEIGDLCDQLDVVQGVLVVQKQWSNVANNCIAARVASNDFSVSVSDTNLLFLPQGVTWQEGIQTSTTNGTSQTITLSATGQPPGVSVSFSPPAVTSGQNSEMSIQALPGSPLSPYLLAIQGVGATTHSAALEVQPTPAPNWTNATLSHGWSNWGGGYPTPGYIMDNSGFVHLRGCLKSGALNAAAFNLPPGYRPSFWTEVPGYSNRGNAIVPGNVAISPNGDVVMKNGSSSELCVEGVTFLADQPPGSFLPWTSASLNPGWVNWGGGYPTPGYALDNAGFVHLRGCLKGGALNAAAFNLPPGYRPSFWAEVPVYSNSGNAIVSGNVAVSPNGDAIMKNGSNSLLCIEGVTFQAARTGQWQYITPSLPAPGSSWINWGGGYPTPGYLLDSEGFVHLRGCLKAGAMNAPAFNLPSGYRPAASTEIQTYSNSGNAIVPGNVRVDPNGDVLMKNGSNSLLCIEGVTFQAAQ